MNRRASDALCAFIYVSVIGSLALVIVRELVH
jgi:hypothetical protein